MMKTEYNRRIAEKKIEAIQLLLEKIRENKDNCRTSEWKKQKDCPLCLYTFKRYNGFMRHVFENTVRWRSFCPYCVKAFTGFLWTKPESKIMLKSRMMYDDDEWIHSCSALYFEDKDEYGELLKLDMRNPKNRKRWRAFMDELERRCIVAIQRLERREK